MLSPCPSESLKGGSAGIAQQTSEGDSLDPCMERGKHSRRYVVQVSPGLQVLTWAELVNVQSLTMRLAIRSIVFPEAGLRSLEPSECNFFCCHLQERLHFFVLTCFMKHLKAL